MPIFSNAERGLVFFAHVPKTGGTYIEMLLSKNGLEQSYRLGGPATFAHKISPQHFHRAIFEQFLDVSAFPLAFMSVRHPLDRLISEYRAKLDKHGKPLGEWLDGIEEAFLKNRSAYDNHLRPQKEFHHPALEVHRSEGQFDRFWAKRIAFRLGLEFEHLVVKRRRNTKDTVAVEHAADDLRKAQDFCLRHYAEDYEYFDYDPDEAEELKRAGLGQGRPARDLKAGTYRNAVVQDIIGGPVRTDERFKWSGGVYAANGEAVQAAMIFRNRRKLYNEALRPVEGTVPGRAIYAGLWSKHFGHFLTEGLSRLWYQYETKDKDARLVWSTRAGPTPASGPNDTGGWRQDILAHLGIRNEIVLVERPMQVEELIVPRPGFEIPGTLHRRHIDFLESGGVRHEPEPGRRVWLSRSRLTDRSSTKGMEKIEADLEAAGWTIVYPETLPFDQQIRTLAGAERIAGEEGSAMHALLFLGGAERLRVDIFPRDEALKRTYWMIAERKGFEQHEHSLGAPTVLSLQHSVLAKAHASLQPILDVLT